MKNPKPTLIENSKFAINKVEGRAEPIKVFRSAKEAGSIIDTEVRSTAEGRSDSNRPPKTSVDISKTVRKSKLSRQSSKESITSKKSGGSIASRKQSKESPKSKNEFPLRNTLASVLSKVPGQVEKNPITNQLINPFENSPIFNTKTARELKFSDKTSPQNNKPSYLQQTLTSSSKPHLTGSPNPGTFKLMLEKADHSQPKENKESTSRIANIVMALKSGNQCNSQDGFDSDRVAAGEDTRDTPTSQNAGIIFQNTSRFLQSEDNSVLSWKQEKNSALPDSKTSFKPRTPRLEKYNPSTLSQVISKNAK